MVVDQDTDNLRRIQKGLRTSRKSGATLGNYQESRIPALPPDTGQLHGREMIQAPDRPILDHSFLMTLEMDVAAAQSRQIGQTADGRRVIAPIIGGSFEGPRLRGTVLPGGADWVRIRPDGAMSIDVRLTLETDDGVPIYVTYQGRLLASPEMLRNWLEANLSTRRAIPSRSWRDSRRAMNVMLGSMT